MSRMAIVFRIASSLLVISLFLTPHSAALDTRAISVVSDLNHDSGKVGRYTALVIGINDYVDQAIPDLSTALNDATEMATVLKDRYGFKVKTLMDGQATRKAMYEALRSLAARSEPNDSVLIYYAGHGDLDRQYGDGWWIPSDSVAGDPTTYLDNVQVQKAMRGMKARHVLLISDSCYSGTLFGQARSLPPVINDNYYLNLYNEKSRWGMTSGNKTPVADDGAEGHSVFAYQLLKELKSNPKPYISIQEIYTNIAPIVGNNSEQTPLCRPVRNTGDQGGQFVFIAAAPKGKSTAAVSEKTQQASDLTDERSELERERQELERLKIEIERARLEEERRRLADEKKRVEAAKQRCTFAPETLKIHADGSETYTRGITKEGCQYEIVIRGVYHYGFSRSRQRDPADAVYNYPIGKKLYRTDMLRISGAVVEPVQSDMNAHVYAFQVDGNGRRIDFRIKDSNYSDNIGYMEAKVTGMSDSEGIAGFPPKAGFATIAGNPFIGEWEGMSRCVEPRKSPSSFKFRVWWGKDRIDCHDYSSKNRFSEGAIFSKHGDRYKLECPWDRSGSSRTGVYVFFIDEDDRDRIDGYETTTQSCLRYEYQMSRR